MAFNHYLIVADSDLYEYKGLTKSVLMTIALMVIDEPEEDERGKPKGKPDPDAGWCVAGQDYIAARLGMSPDAVSAIVNILKQDGWLEVVNYRTRRGYMKNKYRIPAAKLQEMKGREFKKDELGNFVRGKQEKKSRNNPRGKDGAFLASASRKDSLRHGAVRPVATVPLGLAAPCGDPCGTEPSSEVSDVQQHVLELVKHDDSNASLDHFVETPSVRPGEPGPGATSLSAYLSEDEDFPPPVNPKAQVEIPPAAHDPRFPVCKCGYAARAGRKCPYCKSETPKKNREAVLPKVDFTNPVRTHDWTKNKDVCCVCQASRDEARYDGIACETAEGTGA